MDHLQATRISSPYQRDTEELLQLMEHMTKNADTLQQQVLTDILARNAHTEYLQRYKLDGQTDRQNFKQKLPLATYEDLQPYIQRIANGDRSPILSAHPISGFFTSSGTSGGERKLIPSTEEEWDRRELFYCIIWSTMKTFVPGLDNGKGLYFLFVKSETKTAGGLPARPALTGYYKSNQFQNARQYDLYTSPDEAIQCLDASQSMYAQMLCGLSQNKQVLRLGAVFASGLLRAIRFLELHWKELAHDIATATLNPKITDPSVRGSVSELLLEPNPELATFIINECSEGNWEGIIRRIWPNAKYMDTIATGAMAPYIPALQYYSSGLPLASTLYASSECYFAINLYPLCEPSEISYTLVPNMAYFEFLPHPHQGERDSAVDLADVEPGKEYELVVTTFAGLYRYKVGDILKVVGFHNSAPRIQFIKRKNVLLSIDADKTDEVELHKAVVTASELLHEFEMCVVDYTSYADTKTIPGHYVVFWELLAKNPGKEEPGPRDFENCCLAMEEALNSVYRQGRVENQSIGPLEIRIVESGTFQEVMEQAISKGASIDQYKVPRCVNSTHILELLDSRVLSSYVSPACPHWMPTPQL